MYFKCSLIKIVVNFNLSPQRRQLMMFLFKKLKLLSKSRLILNKFELKFIKNYAQNFRIPIKHASNILTLLKEK